MLDSYVGYGVDGFAGAHRPEINVVHKISMFEVKLENMTHWYAGVPFTKTEFIDDEGDVWVTKHYINGWFHVAYTAHDKGVRESCLYGPLMPTI